MNSIVFKLKFDKNHFFDVHVASSSANCNRSNISVWLWFVIALHSSLISRFISEKHDIKPKKQRKKIRNEILFIACFETETFAVKNVKHLPKIHDNFILYMLNTEFHLLLPSRMIHTLILLLNLYEIMQLLLCWRICGKIFSLNIIVICLLLFFYYISLLFDLKECKLLLSNEYPCFNRSRIE